MDVRSLLRRHPAFALLPDAPIEAFARVALLDSLRRGDHVWARDAVAQHFVLIARGLVKVQLGSAAARQVVIDLAGPGDSLGDAAALDGAAYDHDATVLTETAIVVRLPRVEVIEAFEGCGAAALAFARRFGEAAGAANRRLALFTSGTEERLARTLIELGERFGDELEDGTTLIPLRLTRGDIAALVGTTVETTIRTLSRWSREGVISTSEFGLKVHDLATLTRRSGDASVGFDGWSAA